MPKSRLGLGGRGVPERYTVIKVLGEHNQTLHHKVIDQETGRVVVTAPYTCAPTGAEALNAQNFSIQLLLHMLDVCKEGKGG